MTKGYTKLFADIITSSVWSEDNNTRIMWITMLASSDASGYVSGTIPGMAAMSRLSLEDAEKAIKILCDPDPYSRTPDSEGRRLVPCDGGWTITTYTKHRERRDVSERREYQRQWDRENRPSGHNRQPQSDKKSDTVRPKQKQKQRKA